MLEKPEFKDGKIIKCLQDEFGLNVKNLSFLPLGADLNTAVYRVVTHDETVYFLKLRKGHFNEASVLVPNFLSELGVQQVIPSYRTKSGQGWANLPPFKVILYPHADGQNASEKNLSHRQWTEFGIALKKLHTAHIPSTITSNIECEKFSPKWRNIVKIFLKRIEEETFNEPVAAEMAAFLTVKSHQTHKLIKRAEQFAQMLQQQPPEYVLCHADIHGWNLLLDSKEQLYMVDWDTLIFAPKERDLMFIGSGLGFSGYTPREEETLFYQGYGQTNINQIALAYYRYERIIEDIAVYYEQIFLSEEGGEDRKQSLTYFKSNFLPNGTIELAYQSDKTLIND